MRFRLWRNESAHKRAFGGCARDRVRVDLSHTQTTKGRAVFSLILTVLAVIWVANLTNIKAPAWTLPALGYAARAALRLAKRFARWVARRVVVR